MLGRAEDLEADRRALIVLDHEISKGEHLGSYLVIAGMLIAGGALIAISEEDWVGPAMIAGGIAAVWRYFDMRAQVQLAREHRDFIVRRWRDLGYDAHGSDSGASYIADK